MERIKRTAEKQHTDLTGSCYKCRKPVTQANYCHGCKEYICQECDSEGVNLMGSHMVDDHFAVDPDEDLPDPRD